MALFDFLSTDITDPGGGSGYGVLAPVDSSPSVPYAGYGVLLNAPADQSFFNFDMFGGSSILPDGSRLIDQRANTSFFNFDQSKVTASIFDVLKSGVEAAVKVGVQQAGDSINRNAQNKSIFGQLANSFRSTQTGREIQAASYATKAQNFLGNPIVWLVAVIGVIALFVMKR